MKMKNERDGRKRKTVEFLYKHHVHIQISQFENSELAGVWIVNFS